MTHLTRLKFNMDPTCSKRHILQLDYVSSHPTFIVLTNNEHREVDDKTIYKKKSFSNHFLGSMLVKTTTSSPGSAY